MPHYREEFPVKYASFSTAKLKVMVQMPNPPILNWKFFPRVIKYPNAGRDIGTGSTVVGN